MATLPPHKYRELVNELRDAALVYQNAQQLRTQIEKIVARYIKPAAVDTTRTKTPEDNKSEFIPREPPASAFNAGLRPPRNG